MTESFYFFPGVTRTTWMWGDSFVGFEADLIAAGLVEQHQLPDSAPNVKGSTHWNPDGSRVAPNAWAHMQAGHEKVRRFGKKVCVEISIGEQASHERIMADRAERKRQREFATCWPFPIVGARLFRSLP